MPGNRLELNARLAASLDAPVLMVLDANSATGIDDLVNKALVSPQRPHRGARRGHGPHREQGESA